MTNTTGNHYKKIVSQAHQYLINNDLPSAINFLNDYVNNNEEDYGISLWLGLCYLENNELEKARDLYLKLNAHYQAGFCEILKGNIAAAKGIWKFCSNSEVKHWSICLETLLEGVLVAFPTFLNLRNHLEADLGYLLRSKQLQFADNIIYLLDDLVQINLECYKFVGRSLLNNGFRDKSVQFLLKGQKLLPNDPEIYYHLGQYSLQVKAYPEAESMFKHCILISPHYTPAKDRLKEMKEQKLIK